MQKLLRHDHPGAPLPSNRDPVAQGRAGHGDGAEDGQSLYLKTPRDWWTGVSPDDANCTGLDSDGKLHSLTPPDLRTCSRAEVMDYFNNSWTLTELLFSGLVSEESFYRAPIHGLRHPLVFYYIHPAALYANKLRLAGLVKDPINSHYEALFETGVDEMSWDDMSKNTMAWPALHLLHDYRRLVYSAVKEVIETHDGLADGHATVTSEGPLWALFMAFEHERIHLETSSVLMRELPATLVAKPSQWPDYHPFLSENVATNYPPEPTIDYPTNPMMPVSSGQVFIGKPADFPTYGWDNEYGSRTQIVEAFAVSKHLICNGEFWHFVADGGYQEQRFWTENGWQWRTFRNAKWPTFWSPDGPAGSNYYRLRTIFEIIPMPWSCPAVINFHEAQAYCRWREEKEGSEDASTYRLLSEAEHNRLRETASPGEYNYNSNLIWGGESPVGTDHKGDPDGVTDLFGNVWQWSSDHFNPLPGFRVHKYYDDFSTPCFDGEHQMILGGSFISTGGEASQWARFHFRPHFFQHAGFRLVASTTDGGAIKIADGDSTEEPYSELEVLNQYLTLHYAPPEVQMPFDFISRDLTRFPQRCADLVLRWANKLEIKTTRALDVGCAVGGAAFALAESFDSVMAVDLSKTFINAAKTIQLDGQIEFNCKQEGKLVFPVRASVDKAVSERVTFRRSDACALPADFTDFDAVLIANVLCRVVSPLACLARMGGSRGVVRRGGILVITTPFTWMENFSSSDVWLGGFIDEAGNIRLSEDGLRRALEDEFELLDRMEMPLLIREHQRKYELVAALTTIWRRK